MLGEKLFKPLKGGVTEGVALDRAQLAEGLAEYYRQAGWDAESGNPTRETLERLDIGWVADRLGF